MQSISTKKISVVLYLVIIFALFIPSHISASVSLPNGTDIIPPKDAEGLGILKISNGTNYDAIVKLVNRTRKKTSRYVFLKAHSEISLEKISQGIFILRFSLGSEWNNKTRKFNKNRIYSQFGKSLHFEEIEDDNGGQIFNVRSYFT